jgi:hypothetical protein
MADMLSARRPRAKRARDLADEAATVAVGRVWPGLPRTTLIATHRHAEAVVAHTNTTTPTRPRSSA